MRYAKKPLSKTAVVFVFSQFPMGKVKLLVEITLVLSFLVSIPYGKGKVGVHHQVSHPITSINYLWER